MARDIRDGGGLSFLHVLMVAAENDALPGGKVGGVGDVVRDLPPALAALGCRVSVVCPAYGLLDGFAQARRADVLDVGFRGISHHVELFQVPAAPATADVQHFMLDHGLFSVCGRGAIYCDDSADRPFATDASKFALFAASVVEGFAQHAFGDVDVVHLHDWHAAMVLVLRRYHPALQALRAVRTVYTIHNLAVQGVRPLAADPSSLESWYPGLRYERELVGDSRWPDCVNPMAAGIRLADAVNTVSPSYAAEILHPNAVDSDGFHGGEGLEEDLRDVHARGRLHGILNGCEYPQAASQERPAWPRLLEQMRAENLMFAARREPLHNAHFIAQSRLATVPGERPGTVITTIGRVTEQKLGLLRVALADRRPVLEHLLDALGDDGLYVLLGNGDPELEQFLVAVMARREGFIFLRGYAQDLPAALYAAGDLFLMPSSYEPCGISQMLAMRAAQPCLVHAVGGLKDTVRDGSDGFAFGGGSAREQAQNLVTCFQRAMALRTEQPQRWDAIRTAAAAARFRWSDSARNYLELMYREG